MKASFSKPIGVYAGSFDPPTNGHLWMIQEGARIFGRLIVAVGLNPQKGAAFPVKRRLEMLREMIKALRNVTVDFFDNEYLVNYARRKGATHILRGIRNAVDFHFEYPMRQVNGDLASGITTVFLIPPRELGELSSSMVKGLVGPKGWQKTVAKLVPAGVLAALKEDGK